MNKTRSIVFGGLLAAIHLIAILAVEYVPGFDLVVLFALPFLSVMYVLQTRWVYVLSYAIATFLLALVFHPPYALLYILPTIMVGIFYGYLVKLKTTNLTLIYLLTAAQLGTFFLSCFFISLLYGIDVISSLQNFFNLDLDSNRYLGLPLLVMYCFAQAFLLHTILKGQLKKLRIRLQKTPYPPMWIAILEVLLLMALFSSLVNQGYVLAVSIGAVVFGIPFVLYTFQQTKKMNTLFIILGVCFLVIALPLTQVYQDANGAIPFIAMFIPFIFYGIFLAFKQTKFIKG